MTGPSVVEQRWSLAAFVAVQAVAVTTVIVGVADYVTLHSTDGSDWIRLAATASMLAALGWVLASRRRDNPIGWIVLANAFGLGLSGLGDVWAAYAIAVHPGAPGGVAAAWVAERLTAAVDLGLPLTLLLLPDGRLLSRRWVPVVWAAVVTGLGLVLAGLFDPRPMRADDAIPRLRNLPNPLGIESMRRPLEVIGTVTFAGYSAVVVAGLVALVLRYRRGEPAVRVQLRWVVIAFAVYVGQSLIPRSALPFSSVIIELAATAGLCVVIGAAILRYRLFDIDVVVNRAIVYVALSAGVVGGYVAIVAVLGRVLQARSSLTVSLIATGVVAALFSPLRARLQRSVNRLTYGDRHEPSRALARLSERIALVGLPEELLAAIAGSVAEALRVRYVRVTVDSLLEVAHGSAPADAALQTVPLAFAGQRVGALTVSPRDGETVLPPRDLRVLEDLARQAAVAVRAVALSIELQRSRERLVVAREEERRRLRRDLHDGLGPTLAGISVRADAARRLLHDPSAMGEALQQIKLDAHDGIIEIRRLVADLRPPSLDQIGLLGALRNEAARYSPAVEIQVDASEDMSELPAAVEVAVYRIVSEALANVARHSGARRATVAVDCSDPARVVVCVTDDGVGIAADADAGVGLLSMRERATELDGVVEVAPTADGGTRVRAVIPVGHDRVAVAP